MRRRRLAGLAAVALVAAAALWINRDESEPSFEAVAEDVIAGGVPGVLVRLRDGDDVTVLARGEATTEIRFRVGSVTKTFVAALTLRLADIGALDLNDSVEQHLPGLLPDGSEITVRDLLDHTAGLFDYTSDPDLLRSELDPRALIANASRRERTSGYAYSSTNYLVLGGLLEAAAGAPLGELLRRHVFGPLRLRETTFEPGTVEGSHLHGHERASRQGIATGTLRDTSARTARSAWAAGAVVSTAADLDRFFTALLDGEMGRRMRPTGDDRYGLGLARFVTRCGSALGHTGNLLGMLTVVWTRGDRLLVVAANAYPLAPEQETKLRLLLERAFCG